MVLIIGVSRPPTIKKILEYGTTMGVREFWFYKSDLSEKSYLTSKVFDEEELNRKLDLGLGQSKTYFQRPKVRIFASLDEAIGIVPSDEVKIYLEQMAQKTLFDYFLEDDLALNPYVVVGSERGTTAREKELLEKSGFNALFLSNSTLRVEFACYYALVIREQFMIAKGLQNRVQGSKR